MGNVILPQTFILGNGEKSIKKEKMTIDNINGLKHLNLNFNIGLNLNCGENGVSKTTTLRAIIHLFLNGNDSFIKKYYNSEKGMVNLFFYDNLHPYKYEIDIFASGDVHKLLSFTKESNDIIYFSPLRTTNFEKIDSLPTSKNISNDTNEIIHSANLLAQGINKNIKSWFVNSTYSPIYQNH